MVRNGPPSSFSSGALALSLGYCLRCLLLLLVLLLVVLLPGNC